MQAGFAMIGPIPLDSWAGPGGWVLRPIDRCCSEPCHDCRRRPPSSLRTARASERPDRPGPPRRRLPGLDPRQVEERWPTTSSPAATSRPTSGRPSRRWSTLHLKKHGGDVERSLASDPGRAVHPRVARRPRRPGRSSTPSPSSPPAPRATTTARPATPSGTATADRTTSYAVGTATADGQRFRVLRPHARGGLGAVFVALDAELNREVALKQILDRHADDPTSRARFLLEAEVTGGLEHPGIVPVYGLGTDADGRPYYAMRFIRGDTLKEAVDRFHADEALKGARRPPVAGAAPAAAAVRRRLQRDRVRPQPRRDPPRHQAGERHRRQARRDAGRRLGAGQGHRADGPGDRLGREDARPLRVRRQRRDAAGQRDGDAGVHEPRAGRGGPGPPRPAVGRLQPGRHAVLPPDRPAAAGGGDRRGPPRRPAGRVSAAAAARPDDRPGAGGGLPEGDGTQAGGPLRDGAGAGRGRRAVDGRRAGDGLARAVDAGGGPLADAAPHRRDGRGRRGAGGPGGHRRRAGGSDAGQRGAAVGQPGGDAGQRRPAWRPTRGSGSGSTWRWRRSSFSTAR